MRTRARAVLSIASALAFFVVDGAAGRTSAGPPPAGASQKRTKVVLEKRSAGEYGNSAYSFVFASRDAAVHRNYADLLHNNCGRLHFNVYGAAKDRIASLGKVEFASVRKVPAEGWLKFPARPVVGNVYVFEGGDGMPDATGKVAVKFVVTAVAPDSVTIEWAPLGDMPKPPSRTTGTGAAGTTGKCGPAPHDEG